MGSERNPSAAEQAGRWVPVKPTKAMHEAAVKTIVRCTGNDDWPPRVWRAMLAAAPSASPAEALPCGHPTSLLLKSAETGEPLYCELCDDKSGRRDAERREQELAAKLAEAEETIRHLSAALREEIEAPAFDPEGPHPQPVAPAGQPAAGVQGEQATGEREAFESWAHASGFNIHRDESDKYRDYHRATTRFARDGWLSALAWYTRSAHPVASPAPAVERGVEDEQKEFKAAMKKLHHFDLPGGSLWDTTSVIEKSLMFKAWRAGRSTAGKEQA